MTFKLDNQEIIALIKLINDACLHLREQLDLVRHTHDVKVYIAQLQLSILEELCIKLRMKAFMSKPFYKLKMSPYQEIAFWLQFNGKMQRDHAGNLVQIMCDTIHAGLICTIK